MRLATLRTGTGTAAVLVEDAALVEIEGAADLGALLAEPDWRDRAAAARGTRHPLDSISDEQWAPVVPRPGKIVCVGLNYRSHIAEMGRDLPAHPTLFSKYPEALVGPYDPIRVPAHAGDAVDWEAELAIIIGSRVRDADRDAAATAIAGYSVLNDVTMRDYQNRTLQWLQGKTFDETAPFGPVLVTPDEFTPGPRIRCAVNGETVQDAATDDLVFDPAELVSYISAIVTLQPGDVIASGTPGGVGHARTPARYLTAGDRVETSVDGIGMLRNRVDVRER
ncbi:fumarylacetoacetate hydrolase family protein [Microbacterium timonense]|uniref:fumarylacetoacetate hydrolase family protein n=1 Tax=Microbacterium timonense TaxID=2086576 RepID=UPI000D105F8B|nr:fumarylacetoacetate hydrolase family protein [Microbacterium timonense]